VGIWHLLLGQAKLYEPLVGRAHARIEGHCQQLRVVQDYLGHSLLGQPNLRVICSQPSAACSVVLENVAMAVTTVQMLMHLSASAGW
jgi:hypothetical protein